MSFTRWRQAARPAAFNEASSASFHNPKLAASDEYGQSEIPFIISFISGPTSVPTAHKIDNGRLFLSVSFLCRLSFDSIAR